MDKEALRERAAKVKLEGGKVSEHFTDEEFVFLYGFPRPTAERMAANREKAKQNRRDKKTLEELAKKDYDDTLDELVPLAMLVLRDAMHEPKIDVRLKAAFEVLNRRFGRPSQSINVTKENTEEVVYKSAVMDAMKEGEAASRN